MENFCIAVVLEVGDRPVLEEVFVEIFGTGGFGEVSGSDEDEFSLVFQVEDGFVDKEQVEVCSAIKRRRGSGSGRRSVGGEGY